MGDGRMLVYGKNVAQSIFRKKELYPQIKKIYMDENLFLKMEDEIPKELKPLLKKSKKNELDSLSNGLHQGIIIDMAKYLYQDISVVKEKDYSFLLLLDHLEDPHNLGAIIRTATGAGVDAIILPHDREVGVSPTVVKTSAGTVFDLPLIEVVNIKKTMEELKKDGFWFVGTSMDGEDYRKIDYRGKIALVIGNEGKGMRRLVKESCDFLATIPMEHDLDSLNASVAAGIMMYEVVRHRK